MNKDRIADTADAVIGTFDTVAHRAIGAWRDGGEWLGDAARERWDAAWRESSRKLSPETRRNAQHARRVVGGGFRRGVELSAQGAEVAVATLVQVARSGVARARDWQPTRG